MPITVCIMQRPVQDEAQDKALGWSSGSPSGKTGRGRSFDTTGPWDSSSCSLPSAVARVERGVIRELGSRSIPRITGVISQVLPRPGFECQEEDVGERAGGLPSVFPFWNSRTPPCSWCHLAHLPQRCHMGTRETVSKSRGSLELSPCPWRGLGYTLHIPLCSHSLPLMFNLILKLTPEC